MYHITRAAVLGIIWFIGMKLFSELSFAGLAVGAIFVSIFSSLFFQWLDLRREKRAENRE